MELAELKRDEEKTVWAFAGSGCGGFAELGIWDFRVYWA